MTKSQKILQENIVIDIHSNKHEHRPISTVSNKALSKHHKKLNHSFSGTERSENDAKLEFGELILINLKIFIK